MKQVAWANIPDDKYSSWVQALTHHSDANATAELKNAS